MTLSTVKPVVEPSIFNKRDSGFLGAFLQEDNYRREFTDALRDYVDMGNAKYGIYTDKIYQSFSVKKQKNISKSSI